MKRIETAKREENYIHFIKECVRDLKTTGHCYVYNNEQIKDVLGKYKKDAMVKPNECGYTIETKKDRRKK